MNDWKATATKLGGIGRSMVFSLWASEQLGPESDGKPGPTSIYAAIAQAVGPGYAAEVYEAGLK
jgi:hypothetical protein